MAPELNSDSLVEFEKGFYAVPSRYPTQRYGQALMNTFTLNSGQKELAKEANLFYEIDSSISRSIAWAMVKYWK